MYLVYFGGGGFGAGYPVGSSMRALKESVNRGHFYVWANKKDTVVDGSGKLCVAANYFPAWTEEKITYPVVGDWSVCEPWKLKKGDRRGRQRLGAERVAQAF